MVCSKLPKYQRNLALGVTDTILSSIAQRFKDSYSRISNLGTEKDSSYEPPHPETMGRWLETRDETAFMVSYTGVSTNGPHHIRRRPPRYIQGHQHQHFEKESNITSLILAYEKLIFEDPGYRWLLGRLRRELMLPSVELCPLGATINTYIPLIRRLSLVQAPEEVKVVFTINWDVLGFLHAQDYDATDAKAIASAITITGSRTNAQALSCRQYMAKVWPSTGMQTLELIQDLVSSKEHKARRTCWS